jgi:glycosyltransferase involved in cell wall biosynthesis
MSQKRLRIAHVLPWPTVGGSEHGVLRLAACLDPTRFDSLMYCVAGGDSVRDLFADAFETATYPAVEPSFRRPIPHLRAGFALARDLRRRAIDVVHCADVQAAFHVGVAARLAGTLLVCHVRCSYPFFSRRDRQFLRPVQQWVFVSKSTWGEFGHQVSPERGTVLYDAAEPPSGAGSESADLVALGVPRDARIIGMVARVAPIKDFETLAKAAVKVIDREPSAHFIIVGDKDGSESYRSHYARIDALLQELNVRSHFTFTGFRKDVRSIAEQFEVAALVTHSEGLPLVLLESMRLGKPTVTTAVGGVREVVKHGENGLLHRHGDADDLASALLTMLANPDVAARLATNAAAHVAREFGVEGFAQRANAFYSDLANRLRLQLISS